MNKIILLFIFFYSEALFAQCFPDRHSTNWFDAWISCKEKANPNPSNNKSHWILYDLKNQYLIDKIKCWNINDPEQLNWGMKEIRIDYSIDSLIWSSAGEFTLSKAEGTNRYEGMDWMDVNIPKARYILITGLSNFGGQCFGLAELRFSAEKIEIITDVDNNTEADLELTVKILPNPFNDLFRAEFKGDQNSELDIVVNDLFGKIVFTEKVRMYNGYGFLRIQCKQWSSGGYVLVAKQKKQTKRIQLIKI